ncbi:MAG TPA: arginine--tRNA ligase [Chitinophagaceae bacterium]|nr:arginine--tRNA ligase [Chitinophagaceae bacterium]
MAIAALLRDTVISSLHSLYNEPFSDKDFQVNQTKPEFTGDYTIVLFSLVKRLKKSPDEVGNELGAFLQENHPALVAEFNIIKGFLNLTIAPNYWLQLLEENYSKKDYGRLPANGQRVMVEYSSPNTNKPLHLGHLRNNFLGWSCAAILSYNGYEVIKTCIANDRGIHICKSMVAWKLFANGATPESTGTKGDHFVGDYYVLFGQELKKQSAELINSGLTKEEAEKKAPIMQMAQQMLVDWEAGDPEVLALWKKMNSWVYEGFAVTYQRIGSDFNKTYYESDTYLLGKDLVAFGLSKGVFFKKEDGSVWIDLTADGLDEKIVQRKDGTAVYMTQDIGLAVKKYEEFACDKSIYVVGNEQDYHFKVLKLICQKLSLPAADGIFHLSYGMVELPSGRMKTREGTVVDADDMIEEMVNVSRQKTEELGKVKDFTPEELTTLFDTIGIGALKFFLLRVDPKKKMLFNPEESIDFHGFTGPFIQFIHARIRSILRKEQPSAMAGNYKEELLPLEKELLVTMEQYPGVLAQAAAEYNPSHLANYVYSVAKTFSSFYTEHKVAGAASEEKKQLRLRLCQLAANIIASAMQLLGINVPERM